MTRQDFIEVLKDICLTHGLVIKLMSHDWIIQITRPLPRTSCTIFGYMFDVNPAGAVEVCKEKAATSLVLSQHGVPNIPHEVFLDPSREYTAAYVPSTGNWTKMSAVVKEFNLPVVLKPLKGTGGVGIVKASTLCQVEGAVQRLFGNEYGLAICPFKKIVDEYRCFMLNGKPKGMYRKVREHVVGDGVSTVLALVQRRVASAQSGRDLLAIAKAVAEMPATELEAVPVEGAFVPIQWKHNLGQGATVDTSIPETIRQKVETIAKDTVNALGMRFCSVDVVEVEQEGFMIMEVNAGVMMDSLIGLLGDAGKKLAFNIYEEAVLTALSGGTEAALQ
eukprot:TRINITY_DN43695_c0_g1_i1.p1 TRINITY_DN43695_c0_g1~~TRINITY_DN43695_c0_g1_i1.p1  ORF type:complete len:334 (+),score=55.79 TRINITY_DN43695_c0_g1_i1:99-1100(+)